MFGNRTHMIYLRNKCKLQQNMNYILNFWTRAPASLMSQFSWNVENDLMFKKVSSGALHLTE